MGSDRVVTVGVFARVKQQTRNFCMTELRREGECAVALFAAGEWKEATAFFQLTHCRRNREIYLASIPE